MSEQPVSEIERLCETIEVLSDSDLHAGLDDLRAGRVVSADDVADDRRRRTAQQ
jgi:predicted transcriptional regulator